MSGGAIVRDRLVLELRRARRSAIVTAIGLAVAVGALAGLVAQGNVELPWHDRYTVQLAVDSAKGVVPKRNEVRWAGVVVGRVTKAEVRDGRAVLTAEIDRGKVGGAWLYRDARLRLRPATALNDVYLDVESRGRETSGRLRDGEVLQASRTRNPVDVAEVLNTFKPTNRALLATAISAFGHGLRDNGAQLRAAFVELVPLLRAHQRILRTLAHRRRTVAGLVADSRLLTDELARRERAVRGLVRDGAATLQVTADQDDALRSLSTSATPALRALRAPLRTLTPLARDLVPTSSALARALALLEPQAPRLDRITQKVVPCEKAVGKFFAYTLSTFKYGNRSNLTASPRGELVQNAGDVTGNLAADPTLIRTVGCADGRPAP